LPNSRLPFECQFADSNDRPDVDTHKIVTSSWPSYFEGHLIDSVIFSSLPFTFPSPALLSHFLPSIIFVSRLYLFVCLSFFPTSIHLFSICCHSSVGRAVAHGPDSRVSVPVKSKIFLFYLTSKLPLRPTQPPIQTVPRSFFPGSKASGVWSCI
jgi:hypothetical protein